MGLEEIENLVLPLLMLASPLNPHLPMVKWAGAAPPNRMLRDNMWVKWA